MRREYRIRPIGVVRSAIRNARRNAGRAGVPGVVAFADRGIRELSLSGPPGIILCNQPYGVRIRSDPEAESYYRAMGEAFNKRCAGWTAYVLSGNLDASRHIGLKASRKILLLNGPIDCRLLR